MKSKRFSFKVKVRNKDGSIYTHNVEVANAAGRRMAMEAARAAFAYKGVIVLDICE